MAQIIDRLHGLSRPDQTPIGFGTKSSSPRTPAMLLIGRAKAEEVKQISNKTYGIIDCLLLDGQPNKSAANSLHDTLWGTQLTTASIKTLNELQNIGCDFIFFDTDKIPAIIVRDDGMARGFSIQSPLDDDLARALDDLPVDFLVLDYQVKTSKLTFAKLIELQSTVSKVGKHIFVKVDECPNSDELSLLRDLPVDAIVLDVDSTNDLLVSDARNVINTLEPRKPRGHRETPLIPTATPVEEFDHSHENKSI